MVAVSNLVEEQKRIARRQAITRWENRTATREEGLRRIQQSGIGAADSAEQRNAHLLRETTKAGLKFKERIVGGTIDFTVIAPGEAAARAAKPVARLVRLPSGGYEPRPIATGFMVSPGLLMTNHHVFPRKEDAFEAVANFDYVQDERGVSKGTYFQIRADVFYFSDPDLDISLVAVSAQGTNGETLSSIGYCRLIPATGKILTGMPVNIIQHPEGHPRTFAVTNNRLVDILPDGFLHYETDTLAGSSGSPLFNADWELFGIHHAGIPKIVDGQIVTRSGNPFNEDADNESDIVWCANEGTRVSAIVRRLRQEDSLSSEAQALLNSLLSTTTDVTESVPSLITLPADAPHGGNMSNILFSFSGPVTINVSGTPHESQSEGANHSKLSTSPGASVAEIKQSFDPDYANRTGYDEKFLGVRIPIPEFDKRRTEELYCVADYREYVQSDRSIPETDTSGMDEKDPYLLHYYHFSLCLNKTFRMCAWTASNVDYREDMRQDPRKRQAFGGENWTADPRVPGEFQLQERDIYGPGKRIDRGHIVRREDNCWGAPGEETAFSNADTYHWTNCTPQHEAFNQENPRDNFTKVPDFYTGTKGIWGELESAVASHLKDGGGQATLFAGPVLTTDTVKMVEVSGVQVPMPTLFWKVIIVPASTARHPKLLAYGYVLSQADVIKRFDLEIREALLLPAKFEKKQRSLKDISDLTGVAFPEIVFAADQFGLG